MDPGDVAREIARLDAEATPGPWDAPGERLWEGLLTSNDGEAPLANFDTVPPIVGHRNAWLCATLRNNAARIAGWLTDLAALGAEDGERLALARELHDARIERDEASRALEWLTNASCGVSKGGGDVTGEELHEAVESAKRALGRGEETHDKETP